MIETDRTAITIVEKLTRMNSVISMVGRRSDELNILTAPIAARHRNSRALMVIVV
jgi:hypothetical protein